MATVSPDWESLPPPLRAKDHPELYIGEKPTSDSHLAVQDTPVASLATVRDAPRRLISEVIGAIAMNYELNTLPPPLRAIRCREMHTAEASGTSALTDTEKTRSIPAIPAAVTPSSNSAEGELLKKGGLLPKPKDTELDLMDNPYSAAADKGSAGSCAPLIESGLPYTKEIGVSSSQWTLYVAPIFLL